MARKKMVDIPLAAETKELDFKGFIGSDETVDRDGDGGQEEGIGVSDAFVRGVMPDALSSWLQRAAKTKLLSPEEEIQLIKRIKAGDKKARDDLVEANISLVISIALKYQGYNIPLADLIQEGNIGLVRAVEKFDYRKKTRLSTYATYWIKQTMTRALDNESRTIRLPAYMVAKVLHFQKEVERLRQEYGRELTLDEISTKTGLSTKKIQTLLDLSFDTISLDEEVGVDREGSLAQLLKDPLCVDTLHILVKRDEVKNILSGLDEREREILCLRYGLKDGIERNLQEVAERFKVSGERIRQIEAKVIRRLRKKERVVVGKITENCYRHRRI